MATVKLYLDKRAARKDTTYPLKLAIHHRGSFTISLKIFLKEDQFANGVIVNHPKAKTLSKVIKDRVTSAESILISLGGKVRGMSNQELKACVENNTLSVYKPEQVGYKLADHFKKYIMAANKPSTAELYRLTLDKILKYSKDVEFKDVNFAWLKDFELFLKDGSGVNTRSIHFRNIRAVFNDAINRELIPQEWYPFRKFKIKSEKTAKRSLAVEELALIRDYPVEPHQEKYRDMFMLIFYLIGINVVDLVQLKEIKNGRIEYKREKTGQEYSISVLPEAMAIIERYRGISYLLNPLDSYSNHLDYLGRLNENLQKIGKVEMVLNNAENPKFRKRNKRNIIPFFPCLTTYYARHTWATIAGRLEIPIETISMAMGHEIGSKTTWIYYNFDQKKIDEANRKVVEYLNSSACANPDFILKGFY